MGIFSEINIGGADAQAQAVTPFTLEQSGAEQSAEIFGDDEKQQAEANAATAALAYLKQQEGDGACAEEPEDDGEEDGEDSQEIAPETASLTPAQKKKEHDEQEVKRKAEWDAAQATKQEADLMAWENAVAVSDDELATASLGRVGSDAERLTRRNMKICVTEHIQTRCLEDMDFARQVMHPRKNMINCFKYINRQAREFVEQEMKDNEEKPDNGGYGSDVPDDLCYQWAEDYYNDLDAPEDKDKDDTFVPKHYSAPSPKSKKVPAKKPEKKPQQKEASVENSDKPTDAGQLSFAAQTSLLEASA